MICPKCGEEYVRGVTECADCHVPLVEPASVEACEPAPDLDLEVVFSTGRQDLIAIARSILMSAGIEFSVVGEEVQDLFGYGRFPGAASILMGPVRILVRAEDAPDARALLEDLASDAEGPEREAAHEEADEDVESSAVHGMWPRARMLARIGATIVLVALVIETILALLNR